MTADDWLSVAHGESFVECHTCGNQQCAGLAIYRANMAKHCRPHDPPILELPADRDKVFANPMEFKKHHDLKGNA